MIYEANTGTYMGNLLVDAVDKQNRATQQSFMNKLMAREERRKAELHPLDVESAELANRGKDIANRGANYMYRFGLPHQVDQLRLGNEVTRLGIPTLEMRNEVLGRIKGGTDFGDQASTLSFLSLLGDGPWRFWGGPTSQGMQQYGPWGKFKAGIGLNYSGVSYKDDKETK